MAIKGVIVFDPSAGADVSDEEMMAEKRLSFFYSVVPVEPAERKSQASLIQGAMQFSTFVKNSDNNNDTELFFSIETDYLLYLVRELDSGIFVTLIVERSSLTQAAGKLILNRFVAYYRLLHGSVRDQLNQGFPLTVTMDDFVPCFIASETDTSAFPIAIRYAPVEAHAVVSVHALGLEILTEFKDSGVIDFAILYKGFLVSSSLEPETLAPLYSYLVLNSATGEVSNIKLLRPPYGRIGTPAIALGGGASAFGRCNNFDADNTSNGFLFGATGAGEAVFAPRIFFPDKKSGYLVAYILNGAMIVVITRESPEYVLLRRIETLLVDNHEFNEETLSLLRADFAKASLASNNKENGFDFVYLNKVTSSLIPFDSASGKKDLKRGASFFSSRFVYPFAGTGSGSPSRTQAALEEAIDSAIESAVRENPGLASVALKASSDHGWKVFMRRGQEREMKFDFKDPKLPLWKVNADIAHFLKVRFDSVVL